METQHLTPPTRASLQRAAARRAYAAASPYDADAIKARRDAIAAQDVIAWRRMTDSELAIFCAWPKTDGNTVAKRARKAAWVRAAKRGESELRYVVKSLLREFVNGWSL